MASNFSNLWFKFAQRADISKIYCKQLDNWITG